MSYNEVKEVIADCKGWEWECPYCNFINENETIFDGGYHKCGSCGKKVKVYK